MHPVTHLFASWLVGAGTTGNHRDCRLVALAGIFPDADGLPIVVDLVNKAFGRPETHYYLQFHHTLLHGIFGGLLLAGILACFARQRLRVLLLALAVFHLHLLCDLVGSRGPDPLDLWGVSYLAPFAAEPQLSWQGQWRLDGLTNILISLVLIVLALVLAVRRGDSPVGVISRRADGIFVRTLRRWVGSDRARAPRAD